jgi:hypothetical protein
VIRGRAWFPAVSKFSLINHDAGQASSIGITARAAREASPPRNPIRASVIGAKPRADLVIARTIPYLMPKRRNSVPFVPMESVCCTCVPGLLLPLYQVAKRLTVARPSWPGVSGPSPPARAAIVGPDTPGHDAETPVADGQCQRDLVLQQTARIRMLSPMRNCHLARCRRAGARQPQTIAL